MRRTWKIHEIGGADGTKIGKHVVSLFKLSDDGKKKSKKIFTSTGNVNADLFNMEQYIISKSRR